MAIPNTAAEVTICGPNLIKKMVSTQLSPSLYLKAWAPSKTLLFVKDSLICCSHGKHITIYGSFQNTSHDQFRETIQLADMRPPLDVSQRTWQNKATVLKSCSDLFSINSQLKTMEGASRKIHFRGGAEPYVIYTSRSVVCIWRNNVNKTLDSKVEQKTIRSLEDEAFDWYHPMVVVQ